MSLWQHTSPLVFNGNVSPTWIDEEQFWYRNNVNGGSEFMLVDIKKKSKKEE